MRRKGTDQQLEQQRQRGLDLLKSGKKASEVAEMLGVDRSTVYRWKREAPARKRKKKRGTPGRKPKLTKTQLRRLEKSLDRGASAYGFYGNYWTLDRIVQVIWQEFRVRYHPSSVWHILQKLGWSSQRPQRRPFNRDEEAIEQWKGEVLPEIKKSAAN
jgi:transposase